MWKLIKEEKRGSCKNRREAIRSIRVREPERKRGEESVDTGKLN